MGCKIALVDSGIDLNLYKKYVTEYIDFCENKEAPFIYDTNGHGTLCCSALLAVNPNVEIVAVKVLNKQNQCSSERLILALEKLADTDVNIINLSLATDSVEYLDKYKQVLNKLSEQRKLIFASASNRCNSSVLANIHETIGISGNLFLNREEYWYQMKSKIQCVANSTPYLLKGMNGHYEMFGGNSKATALFCGIASKQWEEIKNFSRQETERAFEKHAQKTLWAQKDLETEIIPSKLEASGAKGSRAYQKLVQIFIEEFKLSSIDAGILYEKHLYELGVTKYNAIILIQKIEKELDIKIDYSNVNLYWFYSIDLLYEYIREGIKIPNE